ncbi:hypothetical protein MIS45_06260 [Wielerella bovis]|uniref:hypothetical protein n=1 Tax=Wielerella bovis TaxID=2917790 RepID=UPI0020194E1B|nr:hypothetical protein [Wielerella bovis]ULJ68414.1 hypothetical protein MIS45_06260 [Wielerella bovis]
MKILSLAVIGATILLSACQPSAEHNSNTSVQAASAASLSSKMQAGYLKGFRESFVKEGVASCMQTANVGEKSRQPCECSINKLNASLTDAEAIDMGKGHLPKDWQQRIETAFNECTKK